jgi:hypothetical protein
MRVKMPSRSLARLTACLGATLLLAWPAWSRAQTDLREVPSGTMLNKSNCQIAKGALPDEILDFYCRGDYENPIRQVQGLHGSVNNPRLDEISEKNYGKFDVNDAGTVVDKETGTRPPEIIGYPFKIDAKDPKAGSKIVWNYFYGIYYQGGFHTNSPINWISRTAGIERRISDDVHFKYYDGQPPEYQKMIGANPLNILSRTLGLVTEPADLYGTVSLNWRYRDGDKKDSDWAYVPALRRVRAVNPANRADGLLGSDVSEDDGPYFDGKPEDFDFKLVGETTFLGHFDGPGLDSDGSNIHAIPPGTKISDLVTTRNPAWQLISPKMRVIWADADNWKDDPKKLVAWAPIQAGLVPRPVWVVEATPKDKYYVYGKIMMYFDKQTFRGYWKNKYDWHGTALHNWMIPATLWHKVNGEPGYVPGGGGGNIAVAVAYKSDRASVTGMPIAPVEYYVDIPDEIYEVDHLVRGGK